MKKSQGWTTAGVFKLKVKPNTDYIFGRKSKVNTYGHGESTWGCGLITIKENAIQNARSLQEISNPSSDFPSGKGENIKTVKFNTGNCNYIGIFIKPTTSPVLENQLADFIISDLFLYESNNDYKYKIYKEYRKDILIKEPLRKGDYLYEDNGQIKVCRNIKQYTFTGDEDMELRFSQPTDNKLIRFGVKKDLGIKKDSLILCNRFKNIKYFVEEPNIFCHPNDLCVDLTMLKSDLTTPDIEGFRAWLKANPTTIVYELDKPTTEIVENYVDLNLKTFKEKTYITSNNVIKGELNLTAPMNTAANLENNTTRLNTIEDYVDNNKDNKNKISKLEEGAVTSSLNIIDLQKEIKNDNNYTHYEGSNISINNLSKDSRTSNMIIEGKTLKNELILTKFKKDFANIINLQDKKINFMNSYPVGTTRINLDQLKNNTTYTIIFNVFKLPKQTDFPIRITDDGLNYGISIKGINLNNTGLQKIVFSTKNNPCELIFYINDKNIDTVIDYPMILEGD